MAYRGDNPLYARNMVVRYSWWHAWFTHEVLPLMVSQYRRYKKLPDHLFAYDNLPKTVVREAVEAPLFRGGPEVTWWLEPHVPGSRKHRVKVACPCGRLIPVGRVPQHVCNP